MSKNLDSDEKIDEIFKVARDWEIELITDLEAMKKIVMIIEDLE